MKIKSVAINNFLLFKDVSIEFGKINAFIGPNGTGKSSILKALQVFFGSSQKISENMYYGRDSVLKVSITITFCDLNSMELDLFEAYVSGDHLSVTREFSNSDDGSSGRYYGERLSIPEFRPVRAASSAGAKREAYAAARLIHHDLPAWRSQQQALDDLDAYEGSHPDLLVRSRDDGQFFGYSGVGKGNIARFVRFLLVPAVHDASSDAQEAKGSIVSKLMDLVVRAALSSNTEIENLRTEMKERFLALTVPENIPALKSLSDDLSSLIASFYPAIGVNIGWQELAEVVLPQLKAEVNFVESDFQYRVDSAGHGLQRAFIISILRRLTEILVEAPVVETGADTSRCNIVFAIEEPELYQHPSSQRRFASTLRKLADTTAGAFSFQVIYTTHSPNFLSFENFGDIRRLSKFYSKEDRSPHAFVTRAEEARVTAIIKRGALAAGSMSDPYSFGTLLPRLHIMTGDVNEGFFAEVVVLVEGVEDRAAIIGIARALGHDLEDLDIAVIPCSGKTNIDKPKAIFESCGISTFCIWDGDKQTIGKKEEDASRTGNRLLLGVHARGLEDWPEWVGEDCAVFGSTLGACVSLEIGEENWSQKMEEVAKELGFQKISLAYKNPLAFQLALERAIKEGHSCPTLARIVEQILILRRNRETLMVPDAPPVEV